MGRDVEGSGRGLVWGSIPDIAVRCWEITKNFSPEKDPFPLDVWCYGVGYFVPDVSTLSGAFIFRVKQSQNGPLLGQLDRENEGTAVGSSNLASVGIVWAPAQIRTSSLKYKLEATPLLMPFSLSVPTVAADPCSTVAPCCTWTVFAHGSSSWPAWNGSRWSSGIWRWSRGGRSSWGGFRPTHSCSSSGSSGGCSPTTTPAA